MSETIREGLLSGYIWTFGKAPTAGTEILIPTKTEENKFRRHGHVTLYLPISYSPREILIDTSLFAGAKCSWLSKMATKQACVVISDGLREIRPPNSLKDDNHWSITFNPEDTEGILAITRFSPHVGSKPSPPYGMDLTSIVKAHFEN